MALKITYMRFSEADLAAWRKKRYGLVAHCFRPLKRILRKKARARPGQRFFGEAFVAARITHDAGWYGSFKWLTSPKWSGDSRLQDSYQGQFRRALREHFPRLREFQKAAAASARKLGTRRPVGPDLWLITDRRHRFIEVKLPGDRLARHQLLGLALIAAHLRGDRPLSSEVVILYSGKKPNNGRELRQSFDAVCRRLKTGAPTPAWSVDRRATSRLTT